MGGVGEKIMVSASTGVMGAVLGKLTKLMGEEYAMLKGVRKKLDSLTKELIAIHAFLEKYSTIEGPNVQAKVWTNEVHELAYDIEDSIDLFTYHVDREPADNTTGANRFLRKALRKVKKLEHRHKFAKQIQELQTHVNEVYKRRVRYNLDEGPSSNMHTETDPRLKELYVDVEKLVGVEGPSEEIISRFIGEEPTKQLKVVSIVGSGGSGKTTLAKQVYDKIKGQFYYTAFVSVSQKPNINSILSVLLMEIESISGSSEPMRSYSDQQLIDRLRSYLGKKRYLIVIDIWEKSSWETIRCALPKNDRASRIITTTRINNVAGSCCTTTEDFVYRMKPLSRSNSTKLFLKRTFDAKCPGHLEGIMNEILQKCDGLPLAIVTLASLLANKPRRKEEWKRVLNSIRSVDEKDEELQVMDKILALSYSDLPHNLKNCLLYLSAFPEDHKIDRDILVWRWIAEGFITAKQGYTLVEIGESHFNELINRSLIQPIDMAYDGKASGCRVHDIVLNFIISRSIEENFVTVLDSQETQDRSSSHKRIRRLSVWHNKEHAEAISQGTMDLSHLRSLNICRVVGWMIPPVLDLPVLRVLDLEGCDELRNGPLDGITCLFHLRYLGLRETYITELPVQIGKLEYLQTLDLSRTSIRELPGSIIQLKRLVRLVGDELILPDGFGNMKALQELGTIDACHCSMKDLQFLSKLRVLRVMFRYEGISDLQTRKESLASSLCKLGANNLRALHFHGLGGGADIFTDSWCPRPRLLQKFEYNGYTYMSRFDRWRDPSFFYLSRFPKWINPSLSDLTYLDIDVEQMEAEDLRLLEDLPALLFLGVRIKWTIPVDGLMISPSGFRCLAELNFYNAYGPGLVFEGGLPKLERLGLVFDADKAQSTYGNLHIGIQHLISIKCIEMRVLIFSKNGQASRIIITTRINNVAESWCTSTEDFVYQMKPLGSSDSTELSLVRTFGADKCPCDLDEIMNEIVRKCDGLPLAKVTLASLLANKPRRPEEWESAEFHPLCR